MFRLFGTFFRIGAFTFGGGYAMLPLIQRDIVDRHKWVSQEDFLDLFAVSQSLPGVFAVNIATFVGYKIRGVRGGFVASLATILPSFLIILALALFFRSVENNPYVVRAMQGLRPAVVALIAAPVVTTWKTMKAPRPMVWIPILVALLVWFFHVSPILIILLSAVLGLLYFMVVRNRIRLIRKR